MHLAVVLLKDQTCPAGHRICDALQRKWPELEARVGIEDDDATIDVSTCLGSLIVGKMPGPFPWSGLEGPCREGTLWPNATTAVRAHQAHLQLTIVAAEPLEPIAYFTLLSRFASAVMVLCPSALGIYFGHAGLVIKRDVFIDMTLEILPRALPLLIWVRFYTGWEADRLHSGGCTQGLGAFGVPEIECLHAPETPARLAERFQEIAAYVLGGALVRDGDTVGVSDQERIRIRFMDSQFGHAGKVMRLIHEQN